jgi:hypothetical protein
MHEHKELIPHKTIYRFCGIPLYTSRLRYQNFEDKEKGKAKIIY